MEQNIKYSFKKGLGKAVLNLVIFIGPVLVAGIPEDWSQMTVSGIVSGIILMVVNYAKVKSKETYPPFPQI